MLSYSRPRAPTLYCSSQPAACFSPFLQSRGLLPLLFHIWLPLIQQLPICWYNFSGRSTFKASNLDIYYYLWWFEFTWSHFTCTALGNKFLTLIIHKVRDAQKCKLFGRVQLKLARLYWTDILKERPFTFSQCPETSCMMGDIEVNWLVQTSFTWGRTILKW